MDARSSHADWLASLLSAVCKPTAVPASIRLPACLCMNWIMGTTDTDDAHAAATQTGWQNCCLLSASPQPCLRVCVPACARRACVCACLLLRVVPACARALFVCQFYYWMMASILEGKTKPLMPSPETSVRRARRQGSPLSIPISLVDPQSVGT